MNQLQRLLDQRNRISHLIVILNTDYVNKIKGRLVDAEDPYMRTKDDFLFRLRAIGFHLTGMVEYLDSIPQRLDDLQYSSNSTMMPTALFGKEFARNVLYLFENVLFNLASLLDYTGYLALRSIEVNDKKKWKGLESSCRDFNNPLSKLELAGIVREFQNGFAANLFALRSEIIHDESLRPNVEIDWYVVERKYEIDVKIPQNVINKFSRLKNSGDQTLTEFTFWIVGQTLDGVEKILINLQTDIEINRRIALGNEVFVNR